MIVTRFAPSPTGDLHIGGARTALFNYLFAKHHEKYGDGGKFLLRIEDTDKQRSNSQSINTILDGLDWLGLEYEKPYILQTDNIKRHQAIVQELLKNDKAYLCYTAKEELDEMRKKAQDRGEVFRFQSPWRNKFNSQKSSINPVVRLKTENEGNSIINDLVQGEVIVPNVEIDDFVIARSDESATYMLAVVVDDFDMAITHIIRGNDHLTNAFKQKAIYEAMNWKIPQFAHIPLINGSDGAKMSKRHGAVSVMAYKEMGYLPQAMRNYLLRLSWSHGNDEIINDNKAIEWFDIDNIGKNAARFDFDKLNSLNKFYIKDTKNDKLLQIIKPDLMQSDFIKKRQQDLSQKEEDRIVKALDFIKEKATYINELCEPCLCYLEGFVIDFSQEQISHIKKDLVLIKEIKDLLQKITNWSIDNIKISFDSFCQEKNIKIKNFAPILRLLLTFSNKSSGGVFDIIYILGKEEVIQRLDKVIYVS